MPDFVHYSPCYCTRYYPHKYHHRHRRTPQWWYCPKKYLRDVSDKNSDLKPVGFSHQSALISVSVPLDEIFIHLHATTDHALITHRAT
jgi:hypothetical protein